MSDKPEEPKAAAAKIREAGRLLREAGTILAGGDATSYQHLPLWLRRIVAQCVVLESYCISASRVVEAHGQELNHDAQSTDPNRNPS